MMFGGYGEGEQTLPRVMHISVRRHQWRPLGRGAALEFALAIHEEGSGITWQRDITLSPETERFLLDTTEALYLWSRNQALTPAAARTTVRALGRRLHGAFLGAAGQRCLDHHLGAAPATAVLLDVDETILNLPWEVLGQAHGALSHEIPFGRLVTTRALPRPGRDPVREDSDVNILVVANPTADLACDAELAALTEQEGQHGRYRVNVRLLSGAEATRARFAELAAGGEFDIVHFAGHAALNRSAPDSSALRLADGPLTAGEVVRLPWSAPPYLAFNSACESGRAVGGRRLVSRSKRANGLAAAFLAAGVRGYIGYFWPVTDAGAALFARAFYRSLFARENVGLAVLDARRSAQRDLGDAVDLTGYSAVLFGDAASQHRQDLATAA